MTPKKARKTRPFQHERQRINYDCCWVDVENRSSIRICSLQPRSLYARQARRGEPRNQQAIPNSSRIRG